jgi:predicted ATPase
MRGDGPAKAVTEGQMPARLIENIRLDSFLSFAPESASLDLHGLNVLIGPNAAGKSNLIEALELLHATPTDFAGAIRDGGGPSEWIWKGAQGQRWPATVDVVLGGNTPTGRPLRYMLEFSAVQARVEVLDEVVEETESRPGHDDVFFYYRFQHGHPVIGVRDPNPQNQRPSQRNLRRDSLLPDQSVLAQRKDPDLYPEVTWVGTAFGGIQTFREWTFGRYAALRQPQSADMPENQLLPDARNLALVLNQVEHKDSRRFNDFLKRFFPRFERMSTRISGGTVQFYLHEPGLTAPIPPTRLSDGTIRFIALLATLLNPSPPPLVCIEEPELGLHPDAMELIAELLVDASNRMQLIVTTHSDALVSALSAHVEAVIVCERPGIGTTLRRLEAKQLASWLEKYRLGDIWRMGELGANP